MNRFLQNSLKTLIFQTPQYQQTRQHNITILHLRQKPRGVSHSRRRTGSLCLVILQRLRETPPGFSLRVLVNEFHPNLEKTTSSVLYVILINLWYVSTCLKSYFDLLFKIHRKQRKRLYILYQFEYMSQQKSIKQLKKSLLHGIIYKASKLKRTHLTLQFTTR